MYLDSFLPWFVHTDSNILILEDFLGDVHHQLEIPSNGGAQCPVAAMQAARLTSQKQVFENIKIINNCVVSVGFSPGNDSQLPRSFPAHSHPLSGLRCPQSTLCKLPFHWKLAQACM